MNSIKNCRISGCKRDAKTKDGRCIACYQRERYHNSKKVHKVSQSKDGLRYFMHLSITNMDVFNALLDLVNTNKNVTLISIMPN